MHNCLPGRLQHDLFKHTRAAKEMDKVDEFLEEELNILIAQSLSCRAERPSQAKENVQGKVFKRQPVRWIAKPNRSDVPNWRKRVAAVETADLPETRPHCEVSVGENTVDGIVDSGAQITSVQIGRAHV